MNKEIILLKEFLEHLVRQKSCFVCKHFKSTYSRYNTFDFGTCLVTYKYAPNQMDHYCKGKYFDSIINMPQNENKIVS